MAGLVPAIHVFALQPGNSGMAGTTPGHDASLVMAIIKVIRPEAKLAEETFVARTAGLLDTCAVAWYRAAVLLRLACKCARRHSDWLAHGHALLREAVRQTDAAG